MKLLAPACCLLLAACGDPAYVSLGRNVQSVANGPDAGSAVAPIAAATATPDGCPPSPDDLPDDLVVPITPRGCARDAEPLIPAEPPCELGPEPIAVGASCVQRQPVTCPTAENEPASLQRLLFDVIARCTDLSYKVTASFVAGCATAFSLEALELPIGSGVRECVAARLASERYVCARSIECGTGSTFPIIAR